MTILTVKHLTIEEFRAIYLTFRHHEAVKDVRINKVRKHVRSLRFRLNSDITAQFKAFVIQLKRSPDLTLS